MNQPERESDATTDASAPMAAPDLTAARGRKRRQLLFSLLAASALLLAARIKLDPEGFASGLAALWVDEADEHLLASDDAGRWTRLIERDGRRLLWGGTLDSMHFDITDTTLPLDGLHYGLGREAFPALIEPKFVTAEAASRWLEPAARVLSVRVGDEVKVYPVDLLIHHEVVNDVVGGRPIFAAYCILADLGAVYDRKLGDHVFTFAVSGYTCAQRGVWDGRDAFVLWDRDTESLWWPTVGKAVSGPMLGTNLKLLEKPLWRQTTWGEVRQRHPNALVLDRGQDLERPSSWPKYEGPFPPKGAATAPVELAPRWGEN